MVEASHHELSVEMSRLRLKDEKIFHVSKDERIQPRPKVSLD